MAGKTQRLKPMTIFAAAHPHLAEALAKRGFVTMTDVQCAVLADSCLERDLLVSAQTGSGKTVAFGLSMADQLLGSYAENDLPSQPAALWRFLTNVLSACVLYPSPRRLLHH